MNKEVKKRWVEALRSGKYKQGRLRLRNTDNTYCCLGVLCDISGLGIWGTTANGTKFYRVGEVNYVGFLPPQVIEWADLKYVGENEKTPILMNDSLKYDFNQIADIIEKKY